jgi:hypothetical protein
VANPYPTLLNPYPFNFDIMVGIVAIGIRAVGMAAVGVRAVGISTSSPTWRLIQNIRLYVVQWHMVSFKNWKPIYIHYDSIQISMSQTLNTTQYQFIMLMTNTLYFHISLTHIKSVLTLFSTMGFTGAFYTLQSLINLL